MKVGFRDVAPDRPVRGEAAKSFRQKLENGFFDRFMSGAKILDIGFHGGIEDSIPIFSHAIGIDVGYPGYDGVTLPFPDASIDAIYSSHMLEHVPDSKPIISDWHRVLKF